MDGELSDAAAILIGRAAGGYGQVAAFSLLTLPVPPCSLATCLQGSQRRLRQPFGRRDQLRQGVAGKSQHKARQRARAKIGFRQQPARDAGLGLCLGGNLRIGRWIEPRDQMQALRGHRHRQKPVRCRRQGRSQDVARFAIDPAHLAQICRERAGIEHVRHRAFEQRAGKAVERGAGRRHRPDQALGQRAVADAQSGKQRLCKRAHVDDAREVIDAGERQQWRTVVSKLAVVIVLDHEGARLPCPVEQFQPPRHRHLHAERKLVRRRHVGRARRRREGPAFGHDHA